MSKTAIMLNSLLDKIVIAILTVDNQGLIRHWCSRWQIVLREFQRIIIIAWNMCELFFQSNPQKSKVLHAIFVKLNENEVIDFLVVRQDKFFFPKLGKLNR